MSFTRSLTNVDVHKNMPDYPSNEGYTAAALKAAFDSPAVGLKEDITRLENELEAATSATNLGADDIYEGDSTDGNIQAKLAHLHEEIQGVSQGSIPDGTISKIKLTSDFADSIPTNSEMAVLYLATKYREPGIITVTPETYYIPNMTPSSHAGYEATWDIGSSYDPTPYELFRGDGNDFTDGEKGQGFIMKLPYFMKPNQIRGKFRRCHLRVFGSIDNTNWEQILDTEAASGSDDITINKSISSNGYYNYIKFTVNSTSSSYLARIYNNLQLNGIKIDSLNTNEMSINIEEENEKLTSYKTGQIVKITTPSNYVAGTTINSKLNIYSLGAKAVPTDLQPNTKYSLVYDGTNFVHE